VKPSPGYGSTTLVGQAQSDWTTLSLSRAYARRLRKLARSCRQPGIESSQAKQSSSGLTLTAKSGKLTGLLIDGEEQHSLKITLTWSGSRPDSRDVKMGNRTESQELRRYVVRVDNKRSATARVPASSLLRVGY